MLDQDQVRICFTEITKAAGMSGAMARAGIGAAAGALVDGGSAATNALQAHADVARARALGGISPEQENAFSARQRAHVGSRVLRGAFVGGIGASATPHAAAAAKKYSGAAARHLGREFGSGAAAGAAEHVAPAVRAAMHEAASAAPAVGRAAAAGAAESAGAVGENAARGAVRVAKGALTPSWAGKLKGLANRLIKEE